MEQYIDENGNRLKSAKRVPGIALQSACIASVPEHPLLRDCMNWYKSRHFINNETYNKELVAPDVYAQCAEQYEFIYRDIEQRLREEIHLVPSTVIASSFREAKKNVFAIHCRRWSLI
jgi:hypothetical protein